LNSIPNRFLVNMESVIANFQIGDKTYRKEYKIGNANLNSEFYFAVDTMIQIKYHCFFLSIARKTVCQTVFSINISMAGHHNNEPYETSPIRYFLSSAVVFFLSDEALGEEIALHARLL
jgi:hypothetical protein